MSNIAIIPARGGSKRIPKKNIKQFYGKPLISYSIEAAKKSELFDKIIVSTDDEEIADIAYNYGAEIPFLRPSQYSDDFATTNDVVNHALNFYYKNSYNYACLIYATAPFIQPTYIKFGFERLSNSDAKYAFSCATMPYPIQRTFKIIDSRCEMFFPEHYSKRSQDLDEAYQDAGQFYWYKLPKADNEVLFSNKSIPIILPRYLVQDIDTLEDWDMAEIMYDCVVKKGLI